MAWFGKAIAQKGPIPSQVLTCKTPLPGWLSFDPATRTLSGTPSRSDTNDFSDKILSIEVRASDGQGSAVSSFTLSVSGESSAELALKVIGPLAGAASVGYGAYTQRAILWNRWKKERYQKDPVRIGVGDAFERSFSHPQEKIKKVRALSNGKKLPGGIDLPIWLNYNHYLNTLSGRPEKYATGSLTIQTIDKSGFILEEFDLVIEEMNMERGLANTTPSSDKGSTQIEMTPLAADEC